MADTGSEGRRVRGGIRRVRRRRSCYRGLELHRRAAPGPPRARRRPRRRGHLPPTLAFIATANAVVYCGATPVLVDVDDATYNIDPDAVAAAITPRTRAILAVHQLGLPADLEHLHALANHRGIVLVEDAACAVGADTTTRESAGPAACLRAS